MDGLRDNWLRLHLAIAPLGTLGVTWLLALGVGAGRWWESWNTLELTGQIVPLAGIIYGSAIFVLERTVRMFWALAQRENDIEKGRKQGREEGREEGHEEGREYERERIERLLKDSGIEIPPDVAREISGKGTEGGRGHKEG